MAAAPARRVVLINNSPSPFRFGLFARLERTFAERGAEFSVLFWNTAPKHRPYFQGLVEKERFAWRDAGCRSFLLAPGYQFALPGGVSKALEELNPDAVISTGCALPSLAALRWCRKRGKKFLLWWGGTARDATKLHHKPLHGWVARRADGFVAYGSEAKQYLIDRGAAAERVHIGINTRDTAEFADQVDGLRESPLRLFPGADAALLERVRESFAGRFNMISVSRLESDKNPSLLPRVVAKMGKDEPRPRLHFVGDGSARPALEREARKLGLVDGEVVFWGSVAPDQIPLHHAWADASLSPSYEEVWGFKIVEGMAAGLATLASDRCGCVADCVKDGETGLVLGPDDDDGWLAALERLRRDPAERARLGANARRFALEELSLERSAAGFVAAVEQALGVAPGESF